MIIEPWNDIHWAYQLHYYICFRTHRRRLLFDNPDTSDFLLQQLKQVCERHSFRLLQQRLYPDHLRCLVSLRPEDFISQVVQTLKTNLSREICARIGARSPLWARGYLVRSVGRVRVNTVKQYIRGQAEHHGYAGRALPPVFRYRVEHPTVLQSSHAVFDLSHHVVIATKYRRGIFDSTLARELTGYWIRVANKHGFAIDTACLLPDHAHLLMRIAPKLSICDCVLSLMNNSEYWIRKHYASLLEGDRLWQPSAYAGSCGKVTTAMVKSFLSKNDE